MHKSVSYTLDVCQKFVLSSWTNKKHIIFVVACSAVVRFGQVFLPFPWLVSYLGAHKGKVELCTVTNNKQLYRAWKTGQFIENICNRTPWEAKCLVKAVILRLYLDRYQIPYVLHLGVAKGVAGSDKPLLAHAWIRVGRMAVIGGEGHQNFVIIGSYVSNSIADSIAI